MKVALIDANNVVKNIVMWDQNSFSPSGLSAIEINNEHVNIGAVFSNNVFISQEPTVIITSDMINRERDRRISKGFLYMGKGYDSRTEDQKRISGASLLAFMAIVAGSPAGHLKWHGGATDFAWISKDNSLALMDAQTVVGLGKAAAEWETAHIFYARALKDMNPIPLNYTDDVFWP